MGVYGATYRPITRHLAIWGIIPLDGFYLVLLVLGAGLMLFGGPSTDALPHGDVGQPVTAMTKWSRFWAGLRMGVSLAMVALLVWWAIVR